jgi:protein ImuA
MQTNVRPEVIEDLRERINRIERSGARFVETRGISTGFADLDELFAEGGLRRGTLIEWLGDSEGSGAASLALSVAAHLLRQEGILVVVDGRREFYPPGAVALGIPLERTVLVQPESANAALWVWEQSLRCPGVLLTLGWIDALNDRLFRRFQLGAETGGGWGFLLRPPNCRATPSWAAARICVKSVPAECEESGELRRRLRVWLARAHGRSRDAVIELGELGTRNY